MDFRHALLLLAFVIGRALSSETTDTDTRCRRPDIPDMLFDCTDGSQLGTQCELDCRRGFQLIGERHSTCTADGYSPSIEDNKCIRETRMCVRVNRPHMNYRCTDSNRRDSVCRLTCEEGFHLEGIRRTTCRKSGFSPSAENNVCVPNYPTEGPPENPATCYRLNDPALLFNCSNANAVGSVCELRCRVGFQLQGERHTKCTETGFIPPIEENECVRETRTCKRVKKPNMNYRCTDGRLRHSVCRLFCDTGYRLEGIRRSECLKNGWRPALDNNECVELR